MRRLHTYIFDGSQRTNEFIRETEKLQEDYTALRMKSTHTIAEVRQLIQSVYEYAVKWNFLRALNKRDLERELKRMHKKTFRLSDPVYASILSDRIPSDLYHPFHLLFDILQRHTPKCGINGFTFLSFADRQYNIYVRNLNIRLLRAYSSGVIYETLSCIAGYDIAAYDKRNVTIDNHALIVRSDNSEFMTITGCSTYHSADVHVTETRYCYHICNNTFYSDVMRFINKNRQCRHARTMELWRLYPQIIQKTKQAISKDRSEESYELPNFL